MFIRIRADNGYPECPSCEHCESELCKSCDEADQYEPADDEDFLKNRQERLAA